MNYTDFSQKLMAFLVDASECDDLALRPADNLFDVGVLSSLHIPALIVFLEGLLDRELPLETTPLTAFYSISSMYEAFVEPQSAAASAGARP